MLTFSQKKDTLIFNVRVNETFLMSDVLVQSEYGTILKALATPNKNLQGCYLEEMEVLPAGAREPILSLQILHSDRSLFVGLNDRVLKIPLERCSSYRTET